MGAAQCRCRAARGHHRQRRRQLLRLHQNALVARSRARGLGEDTLFRTAERLRRISPDGRAGSRPQFRREHRRRLRCRASHMVRRNALHARHRARDDAAAARRIVRDRRWAAGGMGRSAWPRNRHAGRRGRRRCGDRDACGGRHSARSTCCDDRHKHVLGLYQSNRRRTARLGEYALRGQRATRFVCVRRRELRGCLRGVVSGSILSGGNRSGARARARRRAPAPGDVRRANTGRLRRRTLCRI